jgi:uncharacterized protein (TIGR03435 family)
MRSAFGRFNVAVFFVLVAYAQSPGMPQFDVASVKPSPEWSGAGLPPSSTNGGPGTQMPNRLTVRYGTLGQLIATAYSVKFYLISAPAWVGAFVGPDSARFDIDATLPSGVTKEQLPFMLQSLLTERFGLKFHHEQKETSVFRLIVAKSGPKLKENASEPMEPGTPVKFGPKGEDGFPSTPPGYSGFLPIGSKDGIRMKYIRCPMAKLADTLSASMGRLVLDETGLKGSYDFVLSYRPGGPSALAADSGSELTAYPDIVGALQEQAGLKLVSGKGVADHFIVDHAERVPSGN